MKRINGWACFLLVSLRLVIGWHFFIEGAHKIQTHRIGKTATNTPWTSEGFFRAGYGPAAEWTRKVLSMDEPASRIPTVDRIVMWSQLVLGLCLMAGLFSRMACLLLAAFLLHVTLVAPAIPGAPIPPAAGHYLYINLYTIEMIALLALAALPTGRWFGMDALLGAIRIRRTKPDTIELTGRIVPARSKR